MFSLAEKSLYVSALDLWIDSMRTRARSYVSHGHSDHAREHELIICSEANAKICRLRFGNRRARKTQTALLPQPPPKAAAVFETHAFNAPWMLGDHRLTLFSAGHVLGSSQLMIEGEAGSFVYTGDFKLEPSFSCETPEVKRCDVLLMECTYGRPQYVFPPRVEVAAGMVAFARKAFEDAVIPTFYAYSLGKAQEAMAILGAAGIPLMVHGAVHSIAKIYEDCGIALPPYAHYDAELVDGTQAIIWPPSGRAIPAGARSRPIRSAVLTGWALDKSAKFRYKADEAFALSDHADFPSLLRYIELARPKKVLLNHGWRDFAYTLRKRGVDATYLEANEQLALF